MVVEQTAYGFVLRHHTATESAVQIAVLQREDRLPNLSHGLVEFGNCTFDAFGDFAGELFLADQPLQ